ncbi:MAG: VOC family protein [Alphaproteobacteria bacterium]|jgi:catechol 2,3-dioxygenase-like lactoylglutathione lyase family enzyme|nr:lactoylglutathione lyase [Rhodospirillaceae bacterium]MDP6023662.1 VOC family protein [Alphaproteobacteria bacterium]MDP6257392.1 VOC family protein [Alphaproteobacteria bacterium]MDP7053022.1 VOC family protein [Alphaproteobacteria bacterium]MDP7228949.1 VOC family protein [Alphaproteobacteria bacterium]|tara:strand:+ start:1036 stop:1419 length:384 start_codon:yes stop_codon:yes gene_type:complete
MFSHITVGTNDFERASVFYDAVMAALGHVCFVSGETHRGYGQTSNNQFWVLSPFDKAAAVPGNGNHVAFLAPDRAAVHAFHAAAVANGGSDEGAPGLRPHYHPNYYGAYVRDPDGNKLQAVCHRAED